MLWERDLGERSPEDLLLHDSMTLWVSIWPYRCLFPVDARPSSLAATPKGLLLIGASDGCIAQRSMIFTQEEETLWLSNGISRDNNGLTFTFAHVGVVLIFHAGALRFCALPPPLSSPILSFEYLMRWSPALCAVTNCRVDQQLLSLLFAPASMRLFNSHLDWMVPSWCFDSPPWNLNLTKVHADFFHYTQ